MKWFIRIGVPAVVLAVCIFGDIKLIQFLFGKLPEVAAWLFWAKLGIVVVIVYITGWFIMLVTALSAAVVSRQIRRY